MHFATFHFPGFHRIKDNNGQYIWQPAVKDSTPDTILDKPVYTPPYVPKIKEGTTAGISASGYLNELSAERDQIGFFATERIDGKLILPEAVKLLKMADS